MEKLNVHFAKKNLLLNKCECGGELEEIEIPAGIVLDPFIGSGTTAVVALKLGRRFIGIEISPKYVEMANKKIEPELKQGRLF